MGKKTKHHYNNNNNNKSLNAFLPFTHYSFKCDESHLMQKWNEIDQRNHHHFALWVERSRLKITIKLVRSNHSCAVIKSIDINKLPAISLFAVIVIVFVVVLFFRHFICLCKMVGCCTMYMYIENYLFEVYLHRQTLDCAIDANSLSSRRGTHTQKK